MSVKLQASFETEIYVSEGGYVALKQADTMGGEDAVILLTASQLPIVIGELQALYDDQESWKSGGVERAED